MSAPAHRVGEDIEEAILQGEHLERDEGERRHRPDDRQADGALGRRWSVSAWLLIRSGGTRERLGGLSAWHLILGGGRGQR